MKIEDVSPEIIEKAKACETPEQIFALAKEEGIELTDEQMDIIAGGGKRHVNVSWAKKFFG